MKPLYHSLIDIAEHCMGREGLAALFAICSPQKMTTLSDPGQGETLGDKSVVLIVVQ